MHKNAQNAQCAARQLLLPSFLVCSFVCEWLSLSCDFSVYAFVQCKQWQVDLCEVNNQHHVTTNSAKPYISDQSKERMALSDVLLSLLHAHELNKITQKRIQC